MTEKPKPKMRIIGVNVLVLLAYTIIPRVSANTHGNGLGVLLANAFFIFMHLIFCFILSAFSYRKEWLLSALAVLLIGFSTCCLVPIK